MRLLLVGEAPGPSNAQSSDGWHTRIGFIRAPKVNLLREWPGSSGRGSRFPLSEARVEAERLMKEAPKDVAFVAMGRAAMAFGLGELKPLTWATRGGRRVARCPHPSGVNRWWNDEGNRSEAGDFFDRLGALDPFHRGSSATCTEPHEEVAPW